MALNLFKKKAKAEPAAAPAEGEAAPAEGAEGSGEGAEAGKKKGPPLKLMLIGAVAGLLVVGGGGGAYVFMFAPKPPADAAAQKKAEKKKDKEKKKEGEANKTPGPNDPVIADGPNGVVFYTLPDLVVNMQTAEGKATYLKLKLTLELPDHDTVDALEPNQPRLQDMFTTFLRELRPEDLSGSQGSYQLRMELLRRINLIIAPAKINSVLIQEMLIT